MEEKERRPNKRNSMKENKKHPYKRNRTNRMKGGKNENKKIQT